MANESPEAKIEPAGPTTRVNIEPPVVEAGVKEVHEALAAETIKTEHQDAHVIPAADSTPVATESSGLIRFPKPANPKPDDTSWLEQEFEELQRERLEEEEMENAA